MKQDILKSLPDRVGDQLIPHQSAIDIKKLHILLATGKGRQPYPTR